MNWRLALISLSFLAACGEEPVAQTPIPEEATAVLQEERFQAPEGWQWGKTQDGIRYGHVAPSEEGAGTVYLLPGYSAPIEIYFETLRELTAEGFGVLALDWPSQGGSSRPLEDVEKIHAESLDAHLSAARDVWQAVQPQGPLFMLASSMGGQLGTRLLQADDDMFQAAVLITPAYGLNTGDKAEWFVRLLINVMPGEKYTPQRSGWAYNPDVLKGISTCSSDPQRMQLWQAWMIEQPELRIGGMTYDFLDAMFASAAASAAPAALQNISTPVLMTTGGRDYYVRTEAAQAGCEEMPSCSLLHYETGLHCLLEEVDDIRTPMMAAIIDFLKSHRS